MVGIHTATLISRLIGVSGGRRGILRRSRSVLWRTDDRNSDILIPGLLRVSGPPSENNPVALFSLKCSETLHERIPTTETNPSLISVATLVLWNNLFLNAEICMLSGLSSVTLALCVRAERRDLIG